MPRSIVPTINADLVETVPVTLKLTTRAAGLLSAYVAFRSAQDKVPYTDTYVVENLIQWALGKDKAFKAWVAVHPEALTKPKKAGPKRTATDVSDFPQAAAGRTR